MNAVFPPWPIREFRDRSDGIPESRREDSIFRGAGAFFGRECRDHRQRQREHRHSSRRQQKLSADRGRLHEDLQGPEEPAGRFVLGRAWQQFRLESEIRKDETGRTESIYRSRRLQSVRCRPRSSFHERVGAADEESRLTGGVVNRFSTVGGAVPRKGPGIRIIDLRGRTVVPGIIDNHNHVVLMGNRPGYHTPLENAYSIREVQEIVAARAKGIPSGAWITTIGGFHRNHLFRPDQTPRLPTLAELDEAAPNNPVYISEGFAGPSTTNSLGKKFFESQTPPIPVAADGAIAMGTQGTGRSTLALRQTLLTFEQRRRGALDALRHGLSLGVTTHLDQGAFQPSNTPSAGTEHEDNYTMHLPFLALHHDAKLPARLRINFPHQDTTADLPTLTERLRNSYKCFG